MDPDIIEINPTELCNRKCSFCARSEDYPNQNLNLDLRGAFIIRKRLEEMDWRGSLKLTGQGEPTLNKKIITLKINKLSINRKNPKIFNYYESQQLAAD